MTADEFQQMSSRRSKPLVIDFSFAGAQLFWVISARALFDREFVTPGLIEDFHRADMGILGSRSRRERPDRSGD
jgi:hypothetical protein